MLKERRNKNRRNNKKKIKEKRSRGYVMNIKKRWKKKKMISLI